MKRTTITIPDELEAELDAYVRSHEEPLELTAVVQRALREFLQRQEPLEDREYRPFRITPVEEKGGLGESDVSVNHDRYLAEETYKDSFNEP